MEETRERTSDLREYIRRNVGGVVDFCECLLSHQKGIETVVAEVFRRFGERFRDRIALKRQHDTSEVRCELYQIAWYVVRRHLAGYVAPWILSGDSSRILKRLEQDLIKAYQQQTLKDVQEWRKIILERLTYIEPEVRAPLVLHDIVGCEDQEIVRILNVRWGVFRHRLNRARLDLREALRGVSVAVGAMDSSDSVKG